MFLTVTKELLNAFALNGALFLVTLLLALPLGLLISFCTMSKIKPVKYLFKIIVWIVRGVPLMLQIFLVYFIFPKLFPGKNIFSRIELFLFLNCGIDWGGAFCAAAIAFVLNYACYFSEIFRGGIESISRGQHEAGAVLGMTKKQIFSKIILLQVIKRIIPPMSNEIITLVKDTALARVLGGFVDIIRRAELFAASSTPILWPLFYSSVFFLVFVGVLTLLFGYIEKKLSYFKA